MIYTSEDITHCIFCFKPLKIYNTFWSGCPCTQENSFEILFDTSFKITQISFYIENNYDCRLILNFDETDYEFTYQFYNSRQFSKEVEEIILKEFHEKVNKIKHLRAFT